MTTRNTTENATMTTTEIIDAVADTVAANPALADEDFLTVAEAVRAATGAPADTKTVGEAFDAYDLDVSVPDDAD